MGSRKVRKCYQEYRLAQAPGKTEGWHTVFGGTYLPVERENRLPFGTSHVGRACPGKETDEVVTAVWFHNSKQVHTMWEGPSHTRAGNRKERTGHPRAQHAKNLTRGFEFGTAQTGMPQGVNDSTEAMTHLCFSHSMFTNLS